jgi:O-antigen/teichoic acid export membrane protein
MINRNRGGRLVRNAVANWTAFGYAAIVSFFLSPFVVSHLGATQYGVWSLLAGVIGYIGLLDFGIRQAVNRYVAHYQAVGDHNECSAIVSAAVRVYGFIGVVAVVISSVLALAVPLLFNIPEHLVQDTKIILVLGGVTVAISLIGGVFGGVVSGLQRFDMQCGLEVLLTTARALGTVAALAKGYGLLALAAVQLAASLLNLIIYGVAAQGLYAELRVNLKASVGPQTRTILAFGMTSVVLYILGALAGYSQPLVIGAFLPVEAVAYFAIAANLCTQATGLSAGLSSLMTPRVSALASRGDEVGEQILTVCKLATLVMAPIAATFVLRGEPFIALWMGSAYAPMSGPVLALLAIPVWLGAARAVTTTSLTGLGQQRVLIPGVAAEALGIVVLSVALVGPMGIAGVALGTVVPSALVSLAYVPRCLSRAAGVSMNRYVSAAVVGPSVACVPFGLATLAINRWCPASSLWEFFLQVVLILPLVPVTAWFVALSRRERGDMTATVFRMLERR